MGFFDFISQMPGYDKRLGAVRRLNRRRQFLVTPFMAEVAGARLLDLGAHDGRWSYAYAAAGAAQVVGIEGRADMAARFRHWPDPDLRARVTLRVDDIFAGLEKARAAGETYDIVAVLGVFYHIADHLRLLRLIRDLRPRLVIIDSEFALRPNPVILLKREDVQNPLNAPPQIDGQARAIVGIPSFAAMEMMADALDYSLIWSDWDSLPMDQRKGVADYFRPKGEAKRRATCALRPRA
jgi:hypothetical protein